MSSNRKPNRSSVSKRGGNSGSSSGRDRQLHLDSSKEEQNPAPLHSSSTPSTRVSTGTVLLSPETRAKDSDVSIPTSQEAQGHNQRQRSPSIDESSSHDPALPTPSLTEGGTCVEDGHRTDEGSHTSEPPPQSPPQSPEPSSLGGSVLLEVGSVLDAQTPQPYDSLVYLEDEDSRPNHHRRQLNNIHGHDCGRRH